MRKSILILVLFVFNFSIGQVPNNYGIIDKKMSKIPDSLTTTTTKIASFINSNFKVETDKMRAVFYWTTSNISYDVPNMNEPNYLDSPQEKISKTLKTKKGVCIHYAEVFNEIANKVGVKTYVVDGYTKQENKIASLSHAWCASKINENWFLFDPTWGAGYVVGKKYFKKLNNTYFKVEPGKMILSHMPFDYLWQFLNSPVTNQEFYYGKVDAKKSKVNFNYKTEIERYLSLPDVDKAFESSERIKKNGISNKMIAEQYDSKRNEFIVLRQNENIEKLNKTVVEYNQAIVLLNDFIMYRNKKFKPTLSDDILKDMIQNPKEKLLKCQEEIYKIGSVGEQSASNLYNLRIAVLEAVRQVTEQSEFIDEYLSKGKIARKGMFKTISWFGIPIK